MYCSNCGTAITPGLSFCNRCGARLEEKTQPVNTAPITAFLTAITLIAICGLGVMIGGSLVLRIAAGLPVDFVAVFMLFTFLLTALTEFMLIRNLSRLTGWSELKQRNHVQQPAIAPQPPLELRPPTAQSFGDPIGSVTDNTTRTLKYAGREQ
jgi:formate hydrogenlyase subunit 3/multisubunit Na+/H+ antiporter MnhD subunit